MTEILDLQSDKVVGIRIDGKVSNEEFDEIASLIEDKLDKYEEVSLYAEMESFGGMSPETLLKDLKFGLKHWREIKKEAIVTDQQWMQKVTKAGDKLFPSIEVKAFPPEEKKWAKKWVVE